MTSTMPATTGAEEQLLRHCARRRVQLGGESIPMERFDGVNWPALLALAGRHGVAELLPTPLLACRAALPSDVADQLATAQFGSAARGLERAAQLLELMALFEQHGIRAAAFKGPSLSAMLYGDVGRRDSSDLDVLVDPESVDHVRSLMLDDAYRMPEARRRRNRSLFRGLYRAAGRDETLLPERSSRVPVEIHTAFAWWEVGAKVNPSALLDRSVIADTTRLPVRTLCPEDLMLALSIHGMMHAWSMLRFVADLDAAADAVTDWTAVVDRACAARMGRPLRVALLTASEVLGTNPPPQVLAWAAADTPAQEIANAASRHLFDEPVVRPLELGRGDRRFLPYLEGATAHWRFHFRHLAFEWFFKWPWDRWLGRRYQTREGSR